MLIEPIDLSADAASADDFDALDLKDLALASSEEEFARRIVGPVLAFEPVEPLLGDQATAHTTGSMKKLSESDLAPTEPLLDTRLVLLRKTHRNKFLSHVFVGRSATNDAIILEASMSRSHARFTKIGDVWFVADMGSANGTRVRNEPVELAPHAIEDGQTLWLGAVRCTFLSAENLFRRLRQT